MFIEKEPFPFWLKVLVRSIVQMIIGFVVFVIYPVMSMLFLGEGANSLLYSQGNSIVWALSPIIIPFIWNVQEIYGGNNTPEKKKMYQVVAMFFLMTYIIFISIWWVSCGFKI